MSNNILIHIGKCGGSTCRKAIAGSKIRIDRVVHIQPPPIQSRARYFVIARAPMARALSAFNWRYYLVNHDKRQATRFPGERDIVSHYGTLNGLAEQLYFRNKSDNTVAQNHFRSIHHLGESIAFYLRPLLDSISTEQIGGVIMQETLDEDLLRLFGVSTDLRERAYHDATTPGSLFLSELARANLRRFLAKDYACLEVLRASGKLNPKSLVALDEERAGSV